MPLAEIRIAIRQARYTNGVASPENGVENCGLKNVETPGPMIAADITTAPASPTALRRRRGAPPWLAIVGSCATDDKPASSHPCTGDTGVPECLTSDDFH